MKVHSAIRRGSLQAIQNGKPSFENQYHHARGPQPRVHKRHILISANYAGTICTNRFNLHRFILFVASAWPFWAGFVYWQLVPIEAPMRVLAGEDAPTPP